MITKRDSISRGSCFCEKHIYYKNKTKTKKLIRNTLCIMYTSLILSLNLAINLRPTLYHSLALCNYSLNVYASSHSLLSPNPPTLSVNLLKLTRSFTHYLYIPFLLRPSGLLYVCNSFKYKYRFDIYYIYMAVKIIHKYMYTNNNNMYNVYCIFMYSIF